MVRAATDRIPRSSTFAETFVRIITETGLRVYKELLPMKTAHVDLANSVVWIPDSKTPNGNSELPLTKLASDAFQNQIAISGSKDFLFPSDENLNHTSEVREDDVEKYSTKGGDFLLQNL